jgi:hypothetical protein
MIIGICGLIGSGKDTAANYLIENHNFHKDSFAATLKDVISSLFGWDRKLLEGDTEESRTWRNNPDEWWEKQLNFPEFTPRKMMQIIGTDIMRTHFHKDIWVYSLLKRINPIIEASGYEKNIIITDCRFPSEFEAVRKAGGLIIRIVRDIPIWYDYGVLAANGCPISIEKLRKLNIHESEYKHLCIKEDYKINNTDSLEKLYEKLDQIMKVFNRK